MKKLSAVNDKNQTLSKVSKCIKIEYEKFVNN